MQGFDFYNTLISILILLIGVIYVKMSKEIGKLEALITKLESQVVEHEKRIQRVEDIQGNKIDQLIQDFKELKEYVHQKVHEDANVRTQFDQTIKEALKVIVEIQDKIRA